LGLRAHHVQGFPYSPGIVGYCEFYLLESSLGEAVQKLFPKGALSERIASQSRISKPPPVHIPRAASSRLSKGTMTTRWLQM